MLDHDDELEQTLGRSSAQTMAHGASLIETFMRRLRERAEQETARLNEQDTVSSPTEGRHVRGEDPRRVQSVSELAGVAPGELTDAELKNQMRTQHGIDVDRIGQREYDPRWVDRANPGDVVEFLRAADRDADSAAEAAQIRDNLMERLREYGLDPEEVLTGTPDQAAETLREHRDAFFTPSSGDDTERDAAEVGALVDRAQRADRDSETFAARADKSLDAAGAASRSDKVAASSTGLPADAAILAARDHPTNPRQAATSAAKQAPKAKAAAGRGADRERGHAGR